MDEKCGRPEMRLPIDETTEKNDGRSAPSNREEQQNFLSGTRLAGPSMEPKHFEKSAGVYIGTQLK